MSDEQPAIHFLKEERVFDPRYTAFMDSTVSSYKRIPGFSAVPQDELDAYLHHLGSSALKASVCGVVDLDVFQNRLQERLPVLCSLAKRYKHVIVN